MDGRSPAEADPPRTANMLAARSTRPRCHPASRPIVPPYPSRNSADTSISALLNLKSIPHRFWAHDQALLSEGAMDDWAGRFRLRREGNFSWVGTIKTASKNGACLSG